jgi:hypothetical protein
MVRQIIVGGIGIDLYNPFSANEEELLAAALDESGLLRPGTTINGSSAGDWLQSYNSKKSRYQEISRLGALLVRRGILQNADLQRALKLQRERENLRLGEALVELRICTVEEIKKNLGTQVRIREGMEHLEKFRERIDAIKERLRLHF